MESASSANGFRVDLASATRGFPVDIASTPAVSSELSNGSAAVSKKRISAQWREKWPFFGIFSQKQAAQ